MIDFQHLQSVTFVTETRTVHVAHLRKTFYTKRYVILADQWGDTDRETIKHFNKIMAGLYARRLSDDHTHSI